MREHAPRSHTMSDDQKFACGDSVAVRHPRHRETGRSEEREKGEVGEERRLERPRPLLATQTSRLASKETRHHNNK